MNLNDRITELTLKYLRDELSADERAELDAWLADPYNKARFDERVGMDHILEKIMVIGAAREEADSAGWQPQIQGKYRLRWMVAAAAAVVVVLAGASWWTMQVKRPVQAT